jgi:hypothetical protein
MTVDAVARQEAGDDTDNVFTDAVDERLRSMASSNGLDKVVLERFVYVLYGSRGETLLKGLSAEQALIVRALLARLPAGIPAMWIGGIQQAVDAVAREAAGERGWVKVMAEYAEGLASYSESESNRTILTRTAAVVRGERGQAVLAGLSDFEYLVVRTLLDRLRDAGL